jgi:hypothetical protein
MTLDPTTTSLPSDLCAAARATRDWKLIEFFEVGTLELYNMREDISEEHDLADLHPDRRGAMHSQLEAWRTSVHALIPRPNPHWPDGPE